MTKVKGSNGDVQVTTEGAKIQVGIEFSDGRVRWTNLTWLNARRFAYAILEETDKAIDVKGD